MNSARPHYLLVSESRERSEQGEWRFVLKAADGSAVLQAHDTEPDARGERLELLAVVRGVEAVDRPAQITLVTSSRYVRRGLSYGLDEWRSSGWTWERFGQMVPVKNGDLWQRLDRALEFHQLKCRVWRVDPRHEGFQSAYADSPQRDQGARGGGEARPRSRRMSLNFAMARVARFVRRTAERWQLRLAELGTSLLPRPWLG